MKFESNVMSLKGEKTPYLTYNRLSEIPFINHAFSTRLGGVSEGIFDSMNLSFGRGDSDENVIRNYKLLSESAGFSFESLVASAQVHETVVRNVTAKDKGIGITKPRDMQSVDALITIDPEVTLVTYYADCTPIFFVDTKTRAIGLAHAGWRGTVGNIAGEVIKSMAREFGTDPSDVICAIGPNIGKCCYEVSEDCSQEFKKLFDFESSVYTAVEGTDKYMINLSLANKLLLIRAGVLPENIVISDLCTKCNSELLWSHRATGGKRGTMCAMMQITG